MKTITAAIVYLVAGSSQFRCAGSAVRGTIILFDRRETVVVPVKADVLAGLAG